jgi:hypothetical protein
MYLLPNEVQPYLDASFKGRATLPSMFRVSECTGSPSLAAAAWVSSACVGAWGWTRSTCSGGPMQQRQLGSLAGALEEQGKLACGPQRSDWRAAPCVHNLQVGGEWGPLFGEHVHASRRFQ